MDGVSSLKEAQREHELETILRERIALEGIRLASRGC